MFKFGQVANFCALNESDGKMTCDNLLMSIYFDKSGIAFFACGALYNNTMGYSLSY